MVLVKAMILVEEIRLQDTPTTSRNFLTNWLIMCVTPFIWCANTNLDRIDTLLKKCLTLVSLIELVYFVNYSTRIDSNLNFSSIVCRLKFLEKTNKISSVIRIFVIYIIRIITTFIKALTLVSRYPKKVHNLLLPTKHIVSQRAYIFKHVRVWKHYPLQIGLYSLHLSSMK